MDIKKAIELAGGKGQVARICDVTWQSVFRWEKAGKLPFSEWTGETEYARLICAQADLLRHKIDPLEICPGAGQYMANPDSEAA